MVSEFSYNAVSRHDGAVSHDHIAAFIASMEAAGLCPAEPIADLLGASELVRFSVQGDRAGKKNAWAILHLDGVPAGAFGSWKHGVSEKWRAGSAQHLTPSERREQAAAFKRERERREAAKRAEQAEAAKRCSLRWEAARPFDPHHPYLRAKGISGEGSRQDGNRLLVPMFDADGALWNLQAIAPDGSKRFAKGGLQAGLHCIIGSRTDCILIGEGFATCAVARKATGLMAVAAFSARNLRDVAVTINAAYPGSDIVILADDDAHLVNHPLIRKNVGVEAAKDAALAVGARVAMPPRGVTT